MRYLSLDRRVPETSALEPKALAWLYDVFLHLPMVRKIHRRFVAGALAQGIAHGNGLDLGTGPGYVALEINRRRPGLRMVGLDLAAHMVQWARQEAGRASLNGRGVWLQADGHFLPFADGSLDLVVSSFALHHLVDPVRILDEIARVLTSGGRYFIGDLCREANLLQRLFAYASVPVVSLPFGSYAGYGGYYESVRAGYTCTEARALLAQSALPPGRVELDPTGLVPILTIASEGAR